MSKKKIITRITRKGVIEESIEPAGSDFSKLIIQVPVFGLDIPNNLGDLQDINIVSPSNGDVLTFNALTQQWEPQASTGGGGIAGPASSSIGAIPVWGNAFGSQILDSNISYVSDVFDAVTFSGFQVTSDDPNASLVLSPKGQSGIQANISDGTADGGDNRGDYAIDLQLNRNDASQVASGDFSALIGGSNGSAIGEGSFVGAGANNTSIGDYSANIGGLNNATSGSYSAILSGEDNITNGDYSAVVAGKSSIANADYSLALGLQSFAATQGQIAYSSGMFSDVGDAQGTLNVLRYQTLNGVPTALTFDGQAISANNRISLDVNTLYTFYLQVIAIQSGGLAGILGDARWWHFTGAVRRVASGTNLVSNVTKIEDFGTSINTDTWDASVLANDSDSTLDIVVQGQNNKTIRWVANIIMTKVAF